MPALQGLAGKAQFTTDEEMRDSSCIPAVLPIAVVGLAGRFPGEATNARTLWEMCCEQRSAWSEIPDSRFSAHTYHHPSPSKTGHVGCA